MTKTVANPWAVNWLAAKSTRSALVCFPYAGGSSLSFRPWRALLPSEMEILAIELPGRGGRLQEQPVRSLPKLISVLGPAIAPRLEKPYVLFGHSMGALLSFEFCRWLRSHGLKLPDHLFVSGRRAPQCTSVSAPVFDKSDTDVIAHLRHLGGTPNEILADEEMLPLILPVLRADFALSENYCYRDEPPLECPITAIGGLEDEETSAGRLSEWAKQTSHVFSERWFPGGHFFLHSNQREFLEIFAQAHSQSSAF